MSHRHFNCRSVIVPPKATTFWDLKSWPTCPDWREHRQIRRFINSLDSRGYIKDDIAVLVIMDENDPCQTRIITEDLLTPQERIHRESAKRIAQLVTKLLTKHERYASMKEST